MPREEVKRYSDEELSRVSTGLESSVYRDLRPMIRQLQADLAAAKNDAYNLKSEVHAICRENLTEALAAALEQTKLAEKLQADLADRDREIEKLKSDLARRNEKIAELKADLKPSRELMRGFEQ